MIPTPCQRLLRVNLGNFLAFGDQFCYDGRYALMEEKQDQHSGPRNIQSPGPVVEYIDRPALIVGNIGIEGNRTELAVMPRCYVAGITTPLDNWILVLISNHK